MARRRRKARRAAVGVVAGARRRSAVGAEAGVVKNAAAAKTEVTKRKVGVVTKRRAGVVTGGAPVAATEAGTGATVSAAVVVVTESVAEVVIESAVALSRQLRRIRAHLLSQMVLICSYGHLELLVKPLPGVQLRCLN